MSATATILIALTLGVILGGIIGWLIASRRHLPAPVADSRWEEELRQQAAQREGELAKNREEITRLNTAP